MGRVVAVGVVAGVYGWWGGDGSAGGVAIVTGFALVATVGLAASAVGLSRASRTLTGCGLVMVGLAAPTGFPYLANLIALICGIALLVGGGRARRS